MTEQQRSQPTIIPIHTGNPYDVFLGSGLLEQVGERIAGVLPPPRKVCIVTDSTVRDLFLAPVAESLTQAGYDVRKAVFPPGEESKSLSTVEELTEYLADEEFTRHDLLVALGGGVIGDMTGFAAASFLRGIPFVQIPTTLLSAVDASVGGKTAVNLKAGKNLVGAFWQPSLVLFDSHTLRDLPQSIFLDGLAEVIKSGAIADNDLFTYVSRAEEPDYDAFIRTCVRRSIAVKKALVEEDERDTGQRQLLNFGHTIGHAIEACSHYEISHGHGVAMGMLICCRASLAMGWSRYDCAIPMRTVLEKYNYPLEHGFTAEELTQAALRDKKRQGDTLNLVVPLKIGECALMEIPVSGLSDFIAAGLDDAKGRP